MTSIAQTASFDNVATIYDSLEADNPIMQWMRARVQATALAAFRPHSRILEIGCGTGTDAIYLAKNGHEVVAVDASTKMLEATRQKAEAAGYSEKINFVSAPAENLEEFFEHVQFDGIFSNFGALNCIQPLSRFAEQAAQILKPEAPLLISIMPAICPWEIIYHLLHGKPVQAFRRKRISTGIDVNVNGELVRTYYFSAQRVLLSFAPHFTIQKQFTLGLFVPPPYLSGITKRQIFFKALAKLETRTANQWPFKNIGDHLVFQFQKK